MARKAGTELIKDQLTDDQDKKKKYYNKNVQFFKLIEKIKLWPSRAGVLHGVKSIEVNGKIAVVTTHCGEKFTVWNSRNSRSARWLRNKWCASTCNKCKIPQWKIKKYSSTMMTQKWGSNL
ncbi:MAG: pyrrolysine--tRNA(Pyl) ligase small subunit [Desulforhopalus sp.]|nr:pyrrolysine--tRNA(Pyl) ligase small subunit [Desulforhopalus sp.]